LREAGGVAGPLAARRYELDVTSQPEDVQQKLDRLTDELLRTPAVPANPRLRDATSYELAIVTEDGRKKVVATSGSVPAPMQELINILKSLSRQR